MRLCMFHPAGHPLERGWVGRVDGDRVVQLAAQTLQSFFTGGKLETNLFAGARIQQGLGYGRKPAHPSSVNIRFVDSHDSVLRRLRFSGSLHPWGVK